MATLEQYLDVDGYRLDITSQLATTLAEATTTFSLGNQTASATPGTVTASGVAQFYAITDGADIIEAKALVTGQPVVVDFRFTIANFETSPKIIPQGHDGQGASQRIRSKKRKDTKPEEFAGPKLNQAIEAALEPALEPEPVVEVAVEPTPVLPPPETPQPPAPVEVVTEPEPITYTPPAVELLEDGRARVEARSERVKALLSRMAKTEAVELIEDDSAPDFDDEDDAMEALTALLMFEDMDEAA